MDFVAVVPPWLVLALALGTSLGGLTRLLLPARTPGLAITPLLFCTGVVVGHLLAVVGQWPALQLGELRLPYGIGLGLLFVWLAKSNRLW